MWFTRVSLSNPVFATMVMLAIVVLGLFSLPAAEGRPVPQHRLPGGRGATEYPGASPEIVESEVTKKIEEGVNSIAGINALTSRSYEGQSVVIIEFQLHVDGRKAAEDVREKVAADPAAAAQRGEGAARLRFDPAEPADLRVAVLPDDGSQRMHRSELTNWADQVLKKRLENVRGVGSVTLVGGTKREINIYLKPGGDGSAGHQRRPGGGRGAQREPGPAGRRDPLAGAGARGADRRAHASAPRTSASIIVARKAAAPARPVRRGCRQVAASSTAPQEVESLALYNGQRTLLLTVQKAQDENTIEVVDGLLKAAR